jgi:NitT/TauT family transport system permease protein
VTPQQGGPSIQDGGPATPVAPATPATASTLDAELLAQRRRAIRRRRYVVYALRLLFAVVLVGSWELTTRLGWVDPFFFGMPSRIAGRLWLWITQGTSLGPLWLQIAITMQETILGFVVGVLFGVTLGILLGRIRLLSDVLSPYIKAGNSIPRVVLGAIFTIMFGLGLTPKVMTAGILVFFVVFFNAFQGVREVDPNLIANARILGASNRRLTTEIILPSALSWIVASLHISFGLALVGAVVGELFGATAGVGELIYNSKNLFDADGVFAGMLLLAVLALVAEGLITALENRLINWRPRQVSGATTI